MIKLIQLNDQSKPSGLIWVQFDYEDIGKNTRQENRNLYARAIESTWTPVKPVTTQFPIGRTKSAQVVRKQFPSRLASAKTVHRSQGDTQSQIVVYLNTNMAIPHIYYVALSRVTTIDKISVDPRVVKEIEILRTEHSLKLCYTPLYNLDHSDLKICYLNARSLHKHIEDVRKDINYLSTDVLIFSETRFSPLDPDEMYSIEGCMLFRNDISNYSGPTRPYGGTAVYSRIPLLDGYPLGRIINGVEFTVIKTNHRPDPTIIGLYHSPKIAVSHLVIANDFLIWKLVPRPIEHKPVFRNESMRRTA